MVTSETSVKPRHRWERWKDADVGEIKRYSGPNKQQRGQIFRQGLAWEKGRRRELRARREKMTTLGGWIKIALEDLVEGRDYLEGYGREGFLPESIELLQAMTQAKE
jgi:hypothetical protein